MKCFECEEGECFEIKEDYHTFIGDKDVVVRDIEVLMCDSCGDKILGEEANNKIDKTIKEYHLNTDNKSEIQLKDFALVVATVCLTIEHHKQFKLLTEYTDYKEMKKMLSEIFPSKA